LPVFIWWQRYFISKFDASGNFVWVRQIGGPSNDGGMSLASDGSGNVYITGYFQGTVNFDPGQGYILISTGVNDDIFICKLDDSGNFFWVKQIGGLPITSIDFYYGGKSLVVDTSGDVYITGSFAGTVDFDPGTGTYYLTST
jgi:hypothetical protein